MVHVDDTTRGHIRGLAWFALVLTVLVTGVTLAGCNTHPPLTGKVVEKDYDPPKRRQKADYDITVRDVNGEDHEIDVSKNTYDKYQVGDNYPK